MSELDVIQGFFKKEQKDKIDKYRILNETVIKGQILFTGSSLMEQFPINELLMTEKMDCIIYNRGVGGFTNDISNPSISFEEALTHTIINYEKILVQIKEKLPETQVYMMAYYPVKEDALLPEGEWGRTMFKNRNNTNIPIANEEVKKLADKFGYTYIDVNNGLTDLNGNLKEEYTIEGVHMYANAYRCVLENLKKYL